MDKILSRNIFLLFFTLILVVPTALSHYPLPVVNPFATVPHFNTPIPGSTISESTCSFLIKHELVGNQHEVFLAAEDGSNVAIYGTIVTPLTTGTNSARFTMTTNGRYNTACFTRPGCRTDFSFNQISWKNTTPLPPPANNTAYTAITLTPGATCSYSTYTNAFTTASSGVAAPVCIGYAGGEVWFKTTLGVQV